MSTENKMEKIVSFCKRRGFVFPACEIYGGFANTYSYGPYGSQLKKNIKDLWWKKFVETREDIVGIDGPILLHPKLWEASGHTSGFNDAMVDCKTCKKRFRADHLVKDLTGQDMEGNLAGMDEALKGKNCPACGNKANWTEVRFLNMMFKTEMNGVEAEVYLRPETAGAIFVDFKNVVDASRVKIPFGIAQIGKAFRNEIIARNFIFRLREFEQMEIEYFIDPETPWESLFEEWLAKQEEFCAEIGIKKESLTSYEHPKEKLAFYSKKTVDIEYDFPFGRDELFGLAHRSDYDLKKHTEFSGQELVYSTGDGRKFVPHVIEPTFGVDRAFLAALASAYTEEENEGEIRTVLKFPAKIAPVKVAVFPLLRNKPDLVAKAKEIFADLKTEWVCEFDDNGNVGKRYRRQDEIGTPFCVTVDFDTLEGKGVTVRNRDTMQQERISIEELKTYLFDNII